MDCKEGIYTKIAPSFDRTNYSSWIIIMKTYLMALGFSIWESVTTGYTNEANKESSEKKGKSIDAILSDLSYSDTFKVIKCTSTKHIWDKIQNIYEERYVDYSK
jgi:hypothetical protein